MSDDTEAGGLVERLRETHTCDGCGEYVGSTIHDLCDEAADKLEELAAENKRLEKDLRTVQNAAKTLASAQGTELEHRRRNADYDHKLRTEHESLIERDAVMTDALLKAEAALASERAAHAETKRALDEALDEAVEIIRQHVPYIPPDGPTCDEQQAAYEAVGFALQALSQHVRRVREGGRDA